MPLGIFTISRSPPSCQYALFFQLFAIFFVLFFVISCKSQPDASCPTARDHPQGNQLRAASSSGAVHSQVLHSFHEVINILCFDSSPHAEYSRNPTDRGGRPRSVGAAVSPGGGFFSVRPQRQCSQRKGARPWPGSSPGGCPFPGRGWDGSPALGPQSPAAGCRCRWKRHPCG